MLIAFQLQRPNHFMFHVEVEVRLIVELFLGGRKKLRRLVLELEVLHELLLWKVHAVYSYVGVCGFVLELLAE